MKPATFDDLVVAVLDTPAKKNLDQLLADAAAADSPMPADMVESLNMIWEKWSNDETDDAQGEFCIGIAALDVPDNPLLRKMLPAAVRSVLPPYLGRNPIMKALGVRDENVPLKEFSARLRKLISLKTGSTIFMPSSQRWGVAGTIDNINASLSVNSIGSLGSTAAMPLELILREAVLLAPGPENLKLTEARNPVRSSDFRTIVTRKSLAPVTDEVMQEMARTGCARLMDRAAFDKYWNSSDTKVCTASRRACNGRSLKEMELLLAGEEAENARLTDEEADAFTAFFANLKPDTVTREPGLLASIVARVAPRIASDEQRDKIFSPLLGKAPFWPRKPAVSRYENLSVWGELSAKLLEKLAQATASVFPPQYVAECAMRVPLKSLNSLLGSIDDKLLIDTVYANKSCSADLLLWIWKNRRKHSEQMLSLLDVDNVMHALSVENLPKAWGVAMRELRVMLLDDAAFQKQLIDAAGGDAMMFAAELQGALFLNSGERQSLMVKLSRLSDKLRDYLENGAGQRILKAGSSERDEQTPVDNEPHYTSVKSHQRLIKELDDIINVYVPENREALKTARAHGDFRENSEFDAAKERRNFLSRRRTELERELARIQPIQLASIKVDGKTAIIGSEIDIVWDDGEKETYSLLGAWDGDPDRRFLAYRTRLGAAVVNHLVGDKVAIDGGRSGKLAAVRQLPAAIAAELDCK
ncbi:MAG: GreA/GreB family elongation factor [Victivallaceae bacterium]|nr:GreA/GreB family elongation factor [Victivallaceae bacterium]